MTHIIIGDMFDISDTRGRVLIGHGVNCRGVMGAGVAGIVARRWPHVKQQYVSLCRSKRGMVPGDVQIIEAEDGLDIANLASQRNPGPDATVEALVTSLAALLRDELPYDVDEVRVPLIGGGIGGIDPDIAERVIIETLARHTPEGVSSSLYLLP